MPEAWRTGEGTTMAIHPRTTGSELRLHGVSFAH
jgi:hypothetical protein